MLNKIKFIFDILIPRFITEDIAVIYNETTEDIFIICALSDVRLGEYYNYIATSRGFNFFGLSLFNTINNFRERDK